MEVQKPIKSPKIILDDKNSSRFVAKTKVYDQSEKNYSINKEV